MRRTPALIVGAGPAGSAAALMLARASAPHLLVERHRTVGDVLCGGFLSWRTLRRLEGLGIPVDALNPDRLSRLRIVSGSRTALRPLPAPALAVSRRRLDTVLLAAARQAGAAVELGVTIREASPAGVRTADGAAIGTAALFLASGKHDVRSLARPPASGDDPAIGLRLRLPVVASVTKALAGIIELHLFAGGYAGLVLQEDGSANLCMAVRRSRLQETGSPASLIAALGEENPVLGDRLAAWAADTPIDAVANVPYGWRQRLGADGLFRLGDQAGVIPSLAGEGIGIALASGHDAATAYIRHGPAAAYRWQPHFARRLRRPLAVAGAVRALAESRAAPLLTAVASGATLAWVARATRID